MYLREKGQENHAAFLHQLFVHGEDNVVRFVCWRYSAFISGA